MYVDIWEFRECISHYPSMTTYISSVHCRVTESVNKSKLFLKDFIPKYKAHASSLLSALFAQLIIMSRLDTPLYPSLHLFHTPDAYLFSSSSGVSGRFLVIDRVTRDVSIADGLTVPIDRVTKTEELHGIIGIVELVSGPHLVVVKRRSKLGDLTHSNHSVYELAETDVLPYCRTVNHLTRGQQQENEYFLTMINQVLSTPSFYFSYTTDLTRSMQSKEGFAVSDSGGESVLEFVTRLYTDWEERFVWNRFLLEPFLSRGAEFLRYCLPLIHGSVFIRQCSINGRLFRWSLVSRRSRRRAGTRDPRLRFLLYVVTSKMIFHSGARFPLFHHLRRYEN